MIRQTAITFGSHDARSRWPLATLTGLARCQAELLVLLGKIDRVTSVYESGISEGRKSYILTT